MNDETLEKMDTEESTTDVDWKNRRLCSDGNCIGVIGPDGCCKVCGQPYAGELPDSGTQASATAPSIDGSRKTPLPLAQDTEVPSADTLDEEADPDWENRRLCSDGNCIGVIGPDGCCKVCGQPYRP
jgi:hypothetical protein